MQVLKLVAKGHNNRDIATELPISDKTVKNHIGNIRAKLHLHSQMQAVVWAVRERIFEQSRERRRADGRSSWRIGPWVKAGPCCLRGLADRLPATPTCSLTTSSVVRSATTIQSWPSARSAAAPSSGPTACPTSCAAGAKRNPRG
jgi:Bacterial regulatory proteins, luxR family